MYNKISIGRLSARMTESIVVQLRDGLGLFLALNEKLLLLLDILHNFDVNLQNVGNSVGWGQCKPLGQRNISNPVAFVELDPDKLLGFGGVFDIVTFERGGY